MNIPGQNGPPAIEGLKVLVCDDCRSMRRLVATMLEAFGIRNIHEARDAREGYNICTEVHLDLIITDWEMPAVKGENNVSGDDLVAAVRWHHEKVANPFVPIIMLTAHTEAGRIMAARDAGVTSVLAKPVSANVLFSRIMSVLNDERDIIKSPLYLGPCRRFRDLSNHYPEDRRKSEAIVIPPEKRAKKTPRTIGRGEFHGEAVRETELLNTPQV